MSLKDLRTYPAQPNTDFHHLPGPFAPDLPYISSISPNLWAIPKDADGVQAHTPPLIIKYCFLDAGEAARKQKVRRVCVEWGKWANISFEEAQLADFPAFGGALNTQQARDAAADLRTKLTAAADREVALRAAIDTAKRNAITVAETANIPGARTSEVVRRAIATEAEAAARLHGGAIQVAQGLAETANSDLAQANHTYTTIDGVPTVPAMILIKFLLSDRWSYSACGTTMGALAGGQVESMMMSLSLTDLAFGDDRPSEGDDETAKQTKLERRAKLNYDQGTILHEFGHVLGFNHEHQSPAREGVFEFKEEAFEKLWRWDTNKSDVVPLDTYILAYSRLDMDSIMMYKLQANATTLNKEITRKHILSELDKAYATLLYPRADHLDPDWNTNMPSNLAMDLIGIPADHPARTKIAQMYTYLSNADAVPNAEWRGVDAADYQADLRTRNIIYTIRQTLSTWSLARGAAAKARRALQDAIKAQQIVETKYQAAEGGKGLAKAQWVRAKLQGLESHQVAAEEGQEEEYKEDLSLYD